MQQRPAGLGEIGRYKSKKTICCGLFRQIFLAHFRVRLVY
jgi:hypothetical protein